ncbi:MAG: ribulose-phosphate 3-epimerase [Chlorobi bacterium]|nr:ribulose-phosphate 3-epimerase [Chlorobiota bacterium]
MSSIRNVVLSPSLLSADFTRLAEEVKVMEEGGADMLHIDVMDGHFVPNITIGPLVVASLKRITELPLDCHLMISDPDSYLEAFAKAGASIITVHVEAAVHLYRTVQTIRDLGCKPGVTLNPATPLSALEEILPFIDLVLLMSVEPGFGGQSLVPTLHRRAATVRTMLHEADNSGCLIEADGGIKLDNVAQAFESGVDVIVSGSGLFGTDDPAETLREMRRRCEGTNRTEVH